MKINKVLSISSLTLFIIIFLTKCTINEETKGLQTLEPKLKVYHFDKKQIPNITSKIQKLSRKNVFKKHNKGKSEPFFIDEKTIVGTIDSAGNKSYFYRLYFDKMPLNTFYNIVVTDRQENNIEPFVISYEYENEKRKSIKYYNLKKFLDALITRDDILKGKLLYSRNDEQQSEPIDVEECGDLASEGSGSNNNNSSGTGGGSGTDPNGPSNSNNNSYSYYGSYTVINFGGGSSGGGAVWTLTALQANFEFPAVQVNALKVSNFNKNENDRVICPEGEIIIIENIEQIVDNLKDKAKCIYTGIKENSLLKKTLEKFKGKTPTNLILEQKSNLREDDEDSESPIVNGKTYYGDSYNITIVLNTEQSRNRPSLAVARTILHEAIHADIYRKIKENGGLLYSNGTWKINGSRANFPSLFDAYNEDTKNPYHNYMAKYYREAMELGLKEYAKSIGESYSDQFYKDMAWAGLMDTKAWDQQYADKAYAEKEKNRIKKVIQDYSNSGINECE